MRYKKHIVVAFLCLLSLTAYYICDFFYPDNLTNWWRVRCGIYSLEVATSFYVLQLFAPDWRWQMFFFIASWIFLSDFTDKVSKIYNYTNLDIPMILCGLLLAGYKYRKNIFK